MATTQSGITGLELLKELPTKTSFSSNDVMLLQTNIQSFKVGYQAIIQNMVNGDTIVIDGNGKISSNSGSSLQVAYPIGSIYINMSSSMNPNTMFGFGVWVRIAQGRLLIGEGTGLDDTSSSKSFVGGETGGEYNHKVTIQELPAHTHVIYQSYIRTIVTTNRSGTSTTSSVRSQGGSRTVSSVLQNFSTSGGDQPHNNLQPYITAYIWKRVS